jgi:hypothetical protein
LQSIDNANDLNADCLKSLITENTCTIESKFVKSRAIENVSNFIFVSNNYLPIKVENGDRPYVIFKTRNVCKKNFVYFDGLNKTFTEDFYKMLYQFFTNRELIDFNARIIPITDIKKEMIKSCKESWLERIFKILKVLYNNENKNGQRNFDHLYFASYKMSIDG